MVPDAIVPKNDAVSHLLSVVVNVGAVPPDHNTGLVAVAKVKAPAVAGPLHLIKVIFCPGCTLVNVTTIAAVPIVILCWLPCVQSIVCAVEVAGAYSETRIEPVATAN